MHLYSSTSNNNKIYLYVKMKLTFHEIKKYNINKLMDKGFWRVYDPIYSLRPIVSIDQSPYNRKSISYLVYILLWKKKYQIHNNKVRKITQGTR